MFKPEETIFPADQRRKSRLGPRRIKKKLINNARQYQYHFRKTSLFQMVKQDEIPLPDIEIDILKILWMFMIMMII